MKKGLKKNQKGSVLLAVVCMTMVCMTLATISLSIVKYTTTASSRNVQRTQAKITAEACLTEFVESYKTPEGTYNDLRALAQGNSRETGYEMKVKMDGDPNFTQDFGDCTLYVYNTSGGIKVDSVCKFSTQTQTASILFAAKKESPYIPSNCLETSQGANIEDGIATPINGSTYIERDSTNPSLPNSLRTSNGATYEGHFFSQYNIIFNSGSKQVDGINKTGTTAYVHPDAYFKQAPTLTVDGYFAFDNAGSITTDVGKTDVNGRNSDDAGYDPNNLSNKDGYIYTFKKLIATFPSNGMKVGSSGKPIDVYCHGAYFGPIPASINGTPTEKDEIYNAFDGNIPNPQVGSMTFDGNFYSYVGTSDAYQNGNVVLNCGSHNININGDMFVNGDIYLCGGSGINVTGTLYCSGRIYQCSVSGDNATTTASALIVWDSTQGKYVLQKDAGFTAYVGGTLNNVVDNSSVERNKMPSEGYDPATGHDSDTRKGMSVYQGCSSNDMFKISIDGTFDEKAATKYIAQAYTNAMTRSLGGKYRDQAGAEQDVSTDLGNNITQIHASVKLTEDQLCFDDGSNVKKYLISLTDQDIVIALPMTDCTKSTNFWDGRTSFNFNKSIPAKFRIDRSGIDLTKGENYFCYFMFYDPADPNKCYYLNEAKNIVSNEGVSVNYTPTTDAERAAKGIKFERGNSPGIAVADFASIGISDLKQNFKANSPPYNMLNSECYIMYLVPDQVTFAVGGNQPTYIQGIVYGVKSDVVMCGPNQTKIYGQVKAERFFPGGDIKTGVIQDVPIGDGSVLGYVSQKNSSETNVKIQYYEY